MADGVPGEAPPSQPVQPELRHGPGTQRHRRLVVLTVGLAALLLAPTLVWWSRRDPSSTPTSPTALEVRPAEGRRPAATASFDAVDGATAYLLRFDDERIDPIRIDGASCPTRRCTLTFDRMTAGEAGAVTVTALGAEGPSIASPPVALPGWRVGEPPSAWPDEGPVGLVVTRAGRGGRPEFATETVAAGRDVEARVAARIAELEASRGVLSVDVDLPVRLHRVGRAGAEGGRIPAGLATWQALAWDYDSLPAELDGSGVTVAVIDASFQPEHPALRGADIGPVVNVADPDASNADALEVVDHGTAVTAMVVGRPGSGVVGVAPAATVRPYSIYTDDYLRLFTGGETVLVSAVAETIVRAVDDGADVVTMSISFGCSPGIALPDYCPDSTLAPAVAYAESQGVVVVASAPNDGPGAACDGGGNPTRSNQDAWPALFDTVVAVGGAARDGSRFTCSPERDYVDTLAPAQGLQVATVNGYEVWSGTSFATPLIAGLVALVLQAEPGRTPAEVRALVAEATDERGRVIPLDVMERLGHLDEATVTSHDTYLLAEAMVREADWPYRGASLPLDALPDGHPAALLTEVLGEPAATDPPSWGGRGGQSPDDPRPVPGGDGGVPPPECWSGLYGLQVWEEGGTPLLAVVYARQELPRASGETVPAGALLGYRAFQESSRVRMADEVAIGQTRDDIEAYYVDRDGRPYRQVELLDDSGEFALVEVGASGSAGREPTGPLGPDRGRMSGRADPGTDRILERGAGEGCGLDVGLVSELLGVEPPGDTGGGDGDDREPGPGRCDARIGIVLDSSPSIVDAGAEDQVRRAATGVVDALGETGAEVRISSFAGFPVSLTSGWVSLADEEGRRLAGQVVGALAFQGHGTNWEAALMDLAGQGADVVVLVTDGNPNEYGVGITSRPSLDATTDFDPVALAAGVAAADVLRAEGTRIVAVGAGDVRADSLAQVAGPTEGEDHHVGDFADLGPSLARIATELCGTR